MVVGNLSVVALMIILKKFNLVLTLNIGTFCAMHFLLLDLSDFFFSLSIMEMQN